MSGGRRRGSFGIEVVDHDAPTFADQSDGKCTADPTCGTGDDDTLITGPVHLASLARRQR